MIHSLNEHKWMNIHTCLSLYIYINQHMNGMKCKWSDGQLSWKIVWFLFPVSFIWLCLQAYLKTISHRFFKNRYPSICENKVSKWVWKCFKTNLINYILISYWNTFFINYKILCGVVTNILKFNTYCNWWLAWGYK